jgi:hypothetical protein
MCWEKGKASSRPKTFPRARAFFAKSLSSYHLNVHRTKSGHRRTFVSRSNLSSNVNENSFLNLDNIYPYNDVTEQHYGIVKTNAYSIENQGSQAAVFLEAARMNHACDRNAMKRWNENIRRLTFHALRNISKDEEITVYYLPVEMSREARQENLKKQFKFTCVCAKSRVSRMIGDWPRLEIWMISSLKTTR